MKIAKINNFSFGIWISFFTVGLRGRNTMHSIHLFDFTIL